MSVDACMVSSSVLSCSNTAGSCYFMSTNGVGVLRSVPGGPNNGDHNAGPQANERLSPYRIGGGNVLLLFFLLWFLGVPFSYLWVALMLFSYLGLV